MTQANNPILAGFYPDPSICRVGKDYYLVNSSFAYFPGVPIFHSRDLAHWEQIGNILTRKEQLCLEGDEISRGIFAPTIRYHEGIFYMITTNVDHGGNFIVKADKPEGPWSEPYFLGDGAPGIDPSLFFDTDGRCYYVGTRPNPEGVTYNGDWEIYMQEIDIDNMCLIGESMAIWKGAMKDAIWPEGPHLYHIGDYYYLMHAEGGTGPEHSIMMARSEKLFQQFTGCKRNPIFTHRHLGMDYPVIYAGHADLVDDENGNWYVVMLASRPCKKHCNMGRETFMAKVIWEEGWPVINPGVGHLEDVVEIPLQEEHFPEEVLSQDVIQFHGQQLDYRLVGLHEVTEEMYSLESRPGFLRLYARSEQVTEKGNASFLGIRQKQYAFRVSTGVEFVPKQESEVAGIVLYQNHENHLQIVIGLSETGRCVRVVTCIHGKTQCIAKKEIQTEGMVEMILQASEQTGQVHIKIAGMVEMVAKDIDLIPYSTEEAGGFVGCTIGMYTSSQGMPGKNYADFAWLQNL